jgi:uncharacterized cupin superfamily protein
MKRVNLHRPELIHDEGDPEGYETGYDRLGPKIGASQLGATIYEMPPGQSICPYHYEYPEEEWLLVLEGTATLRHPGGEEALEPGDLVCFPTGPDGAHKVTNRAGEGNLRVLMLSTKAQVAIAVYPDSDKIGAYPPNADDRLVVRRESGVDYWDRET